MTTVRQAMIEILAEREASARDLSQELGISEKEVYAHLPYVARTVAGQGKKLKVRPFSCLKCGYVFRERSRYTKPGRCPKCKQGHIEPPVYVIE